MSLLTLPTELRHEIYSYLAPRKSGHYLFGQNTNVVCVSHEPPPTALQRACRFLNHDFNAYFYPIVTIQISPSGSDPFTAQELSVIRRTWNVGFKILWMGISKCWIRPTLEEWKEERRVDKDWDLKTLRMLNIEAEGLKKLLVSVVTFRCDEANLDRNFIQERLEELKEVKGGVVFVVGEVKCWNGVSVHMSTQKTLEDYVKKLNAERA